MKYQVGDRVKIKSWEKMKEEFPSIGEIVLPSHRIYTNGMRKFAENSYDRIVTITHISNATSRSTAGYEIKEYSCYWDDFMIVGLASEIVKDIENEIDNRFEILDL